MISKKALDESKDKMEIVHWCKEIKFNPKTEKYECEIKKHFERQLEGMSFYRVNRQHIFLGPNCPGHCKREENGTTICFTIREKEENKKCTL